MFRIIDKDTWKRKPYFDHYFNQIRCTYSITVNVDITEIIAFKNKNNTKLYPLLIYILTKAVNNHEEFRTAINDKGELGVWDTLLPCYTVFHEENDGIDAKPDTPTNTFPISSLPWTTFTGFNLNIFADGSYLLPIFTYGKYFQQDGRYLIPLSVQVHHAVCDGFHVSRFINEIQQICNDINRN